MTLWAAIRQGLAILAMAGLLSAPPASQADTGEMSAGSSVSMGDDMPCCPKPAAPDCMKGCPVAALCLAKCFQGLNQVGAVLAPVAVLAARATFVNEAQPDSFSDTPPPRPPKA